MRVISLGWGVQSFALAAMSALGVLPPVDAAIHADTTHERAETYQLAKKWTPWLENHGVRVITVQAEEKRCNSFRSVNTPFISLPAFTISEENGSHGMLQRQCTSDWKIRPIRHWLQRNRNETVVEQWLGITLDEVTRMKGSDVQYITNIYPFIEMLDRPWTRGMVLCWLRDNNLDIPVKSSCVFCPYHDRQTWRDIQLANNGDWEKALNVDRVIRYKRPSCLCYLTSERKPLDECDFRSQEEHGQLTLWDTEECSGMCFL